MEIKALPKNLRTEVDASVQTDSDQKRSGFSLWFVSLSGETTTSPCGQADEDVQWI